MPRTQFHLPVVALALATIVFAGAGQADAHARLRSASPADGARLDDAPREIRLTFSEAIEAPLSSVTVRDAAGNRFAVIHAVSVPGDRRTCAAPLRALKPGSYVVEWRVVSADGHAMTGSYTFTIRGAEPARPPDVPRASAAPPAVEVPPPMRAARLEIVARWLFIIGVASLLGAAGASELRLGGNADMAAATAGWFAGITGLLLMADAQRRTAGVGFGELLRTSIGHALISRAAALAIAGAALLVARTPAARRVGMRLVALWSLTAIVFHTAAGHAAAAERFQWLAIALQWLHFTAAGVWFGGLAVLLAATRGEPSPSKTAAVARYSSLAGIAIAVVAFTGIGRAVQELSSWDQLVSTGYGQTVLAKIALLAAIAALGALNRWRSVPAASTTLRPLRRFASVELALMIVVLAAAAILATLPPPG